MGYLSSSTSVITAILTERGKQLLAEQPENFKIVKFALSDDEIDYYLSSASIAALQLAEPNTKSNAIQSRLITQPFGSTNVGVIQLSSDEIIISGTASTNVVISTINSSDPNGYTIVLDTSEVLLEAVDLVSSTDSVLPTNLGDVAAQLLVVKTTFKLTGTNQTGTQIYYVRVVGNNSGASTRVKITVNYVDYGAFTV